VKTKLVLPAIFFLLAINFLLICCDNNTTDTGPTYTDNIPDGLVAKWYMSQEAANDGGDYLLSFEIKLNGEMILTYTTVNISVSGNSIKATQAGITVGTATFYHSGTTLRFTVPNPDSMTNMFAAFHLITFYKMES